MSALLAALTLVIVVVSVLACTDKHERARVRMILERLDRELAGSDQECEDPTKTPASPFSPVATGSDGIGTSKRTTTMTEPRDIDDVVQIIYAFLSDNFDVAIGGGDDELRCDFRNVDVVIRVACPQREAEKRLALTEEE